MMAKITDSETQDETGQTDISQVNKPYELLPMCI